ncbi:MAG: MBL fold metallo-hydrolase [Candidatus Firestonebacteria bacterium]
MPFTTIAVGNLETNCYVVWDKESKDTTIIDPGDELEEILKVVEKNNLNLKYILLTHLHFDHVGAVCNLMKKNSIAQLFFSDLDLKVFSGFIRFKYSQNNFVKDGDIIEFGKIKLEILHTPGHSQGSISIKYSEDNKLIGIFTGDTLFANGIGRTDFPGGSHELLIKSINQKLMFFDNAVIIYPGHGHESTIGNERN